MWGNKFFLVFGVHNNRLELLKVTIGGATLYNLQGIHKRSSICSSFKNAENQWKKRWKFWKMQAAKTKNNRKTTYSKIVYEHEHMNCINIKDVDSSFVYGERDSLFYFILVFWL